jgi:hypothetical protein
MATATSAQDESYEDRWIATPVSEVESFLDGLADELEDDDEETAAKLRDLMEHIQPLLDGVQDGLYDLDQADE